MALTILSLCVMAWRRGALVEKNVDLNRRGCALCGSRIDSKWSGGGPGATCKDCFDKLVFVPKNFEFHVASSSGATGYDFTGTRLAVNGRIARINTAYGNWSWVTFEDGQGPNTIRVGAWRLKHLYEQTLATR